MTFFEGFVLGAVQGVTEFLPISSSGHLVLARTWMGMGPGGLAEDAVLQMATVFAVVFAFRKDIAMLFGVALRWLTRSRVVTPVDFEQRRVLLGLFLGTLPAVFLGLLAEPYMEGAWRQTSVIAGALLVGSAVFFAAEFFARTRAVHAESPSPLSALFFMGLFQCLALLPGFSRSGATVSGGLFAGLTRVQAARFSFLLSLPILLGSGLKKTLDLLQSHDASVGLPLLFAALVSFAVGAACIRWLLSFFARHSLVTFAWYRIALAVFLLLQ